jgi:integrase
MATRRSNHEGHFYKDGKYHCWKLQLAGKKPIVKKRTTRKLLDAAVKEVRDELKRSDYKKDLVRDTVGPLVQRYVDNNYGYIKEDGEVVLVDGIQDTTFRNEYGRARWLKKHFGNLPANKVNEDTISEIIKLCGTNKRSCMLKIALLKRALPSALRSNLKEQLIDSNVKVRYRQTPKERVLAQYEADLLEKWARTSDDRNRFIILFQANSGGRISEILGLGIFDIVNGDVRYSKQGEWSGQARIGGKFRKVFEVKAYTKNHKVREVPLNELALWAVEQQMKLVEEDKKRLGGNYQDKGLLFPSPTGEGLRLGKVQESLDAFALENGLEHVTTHDLRRTYATHLASQLGEANIKLAAAMLGDTVPVFQQHYNMTHKISGRGLVRSLRLGSTPDSKEKDTEIKKA